MNPAITLTVQLVIDSMTDDEVLAQRMAALLGGSHKDRYGGDKIKPLLTQENGAKMHEDTRQVFLALTAHRLGL